MGADDLRELLVEELRDLYDAEHQITEALPKMAEAASNEDLSEAFRDHLQVTEGHIRRLTEIFDELGELAGGKVCVGMQGLIEEGNHVIEAQDRDDVRDAALIAAAQKVEHYEIAGYGTSRTWADALGYGEIADMLDECADEEGEADKRLTKIATGGFFSSGVNREAQISG